MPISGPRRWRWRRAGTIDHYELWVDGVVSPAAAVGQSLAAGAGQHVWRVRAVSSLGNAGGWSVAQTFTVGAGGAAGGGASGGGAGDGGGGTSTKGNVHGGCSFGGSASGTSGGIFGLLALLLAVRRRRVRP